MSLANATTSKFTEINMLLFIKHGNTVLHIAADRGYVDIIKYLQYLLLYIVDIIEYEPYNDYIL